MSNNGQRPSAESLLAKLKEGERANLRVYIGAAPGVGKTYQMLEDAHALKRQGVDICVAVVEAHVRRFGVQNPRGFEKELVVEIEPEVIAYVERITHRRLPPASSFWTTPASNLLSAFRWNEGKVPANGRLTLKDIS